MAQGDAQAPDPAPDGRVPRDRLEADEGPRLQLHGNGVNEQVRAEVAELLAREADAVDAGGAGATSAAPTRSGRLSELLHLLEDHCEDLAGKIDKSGGHLLSVAWSRNKNRNGLLCWIRGLCRVIRLLI